MLHVIHLYYEPVDFGVRHFQTKQSVKKCSLAVPSACDQFVTSIDYRANQSSLSEGFYKSRSKEV